LWFFASKERRADRGPLESILLLFLPAKSPLQTMITHEWNSFGDFVGKGQGRNRNCQQAISVAFSALR
jgi:hypothetical protein